MCNTGSASRPERAADVVARVGIVRSSGKAASARTGLSLRAGLAVLILGAAAGCSVVSPPGDDLMLDVAGSAVAPILARKAPGVPTDTAVACTLDYASQGQLQALAENSALGQTELNDDIVTDILFTQGTRECMSDNLIDRVLF